MPTKPLTDKQFGKLSWLCIKISFAWFWLRQMIVMLLSGGKCLYPVGLCRLYNFDILFSGPALGVLIAILLVCIILYLSEKKMLFATGMLTVLTGIIISHHESSGIFMRATPFTTIFAAQFIAYLFFRINTDFNLPVYRQQYAIQIIAATYTLAAISKFTLSGITWVQDGADLFPLQILKSFSSRYFDTGDAAALQKGYSIANFAWQHKPLFKVLLTGSLALETCCFIVVLNPALRIGYGLALALMHFGIAYSMNIVIGGLAFPMVIFFINPLYWLVIAYQNRPAFLRRDHRAQTSDDSSTVVNS